MENLEIINTIRQSEIPEINPNATFQKKLKTDNKMIKMAGKTELFETPSFTGQVSQFTNAETKLAPIPEQKIETVERKTQPQKVQSPRSQVVSKPSRRIYTEEELTAKGVKVVDLKEILEDMGLKKSGRKAELIARILEAQKQ